MSLHSPEPLAPLDHPALPGLVSAAMEYADRGALPPLEELCQEHPELIETVRDCIGYLERLPGLRSDKELDQDSQTPLIGRVLDGRYRLDALLGAGAMGVVFRAFDCQLGRAVAVKILRAFILGDREANSRFAREAEVLAAIRHPSIVSIYDRGRTDQNDAYLVMEHLEGISLDALLEAAARLGGPRDIEDTAWLARMLARESMAESSWLRTSVHWVAELAAGLEVAHEAQIYHRDVKPSNILVRESGEPVLLDFGIAAQSGGASLTRSGATVGTPAYMAPESIGSESVPGPALDVYSLGATLYHLLTLRAPYEGTPTQVLSKLATSEPVSATRIRPGLPRDLQAILDKAMSRSPRARYASAAAFEADLRAYLVHEPISARPVAPVTRWLRRLRRSPALLTGLVVGLLALGTGLGLEWRQQRLDARHGRFWQSFRHLSPNLPIVEFANRPTTSPEEYASLRATLDDALEGDPDSVSGRVTRASFALDHGQVAAAARDMHRLASQLDSPFSQALARAYAVVDEGASGARALDLEQLPEPESREDCFLAAFHALRAYQFGAAREWLADPRLADYVPALELELVLQMGVLQKLEGEERGARGLELYERVIVLEQTIGTRTATTAHLAAYTLYAQGRYSECLNLVREGLALAPFSHVLRINGGRAATELERDAQARAWYEETLVLRPHHVTATDNLIALLTDMREFDVAQSLLDEALEHGGLGKKSRPVERQAKLDCVRALALWESGDHEAAAQLAEQSQALFDEALVLGAEHSLAHESMNKAMLAEDMSLMFHGLASSMGAAPKRARWLQILLEYMPEELDAGDTRALRDYLTSLSRQLVGAAGG